MAGRISITDSMYRTLLERLGRGAFPPGARIEVNEIAAADGVSPTPVRNALNRLVGAGLLVSHSNEGFFAPVVSEQDLRELYDAHGALIGLAIARAADARRRPKPAFVTGTRDSLATDQRTETVFEGIMRLCDNQLLCAAQSHIALRLRPVRAHESGLIANGTAEMGRIHRACAALDFAELGRLIGAYHHRRIRLAPKLLAHMQQRDTGPIATAPRPGSEGA